MMPMVIFAAALFNAVLGANCENAYHAGRVRAAGSFAFAQSISQGLIAFAVVAEQSFPNLVASSAAWSLGTMYGAKRKRDA